ncbi:MAG: AbrB/MazE/SpoVT family DNA-binding domain-containing protein [Clostridia bacterium]|jgi:transcriptional pleiotropic regulator of transition state genes|nr:AbrB/MazE/SpoVT family DNA-binding domain-containing protein [Clostridia bacterium]
MKPLGVVRTVDRLGRIVLPADLRKRMGYEVDEPIEIFVDEDKVILKKYNPTCLFCGSSENTVKYKDKLVCAECAKKLTELCNYL